MRNDEACYDRVSIGVHWLMAGLVVIQVVAGVTMLRIGKGTAQNLLYDAHKSIGVTLLLLVLFRLIWRVSHPWPSLPAGMPRSQILLARGNHALLYVMLIVMPVSGFVFTAAGGYPIPYLGLIELSGMLPKNESLSKVALAIHLSAQWAVYVLVGLHVVGALYHLLVRKDGVFQRMLPTVRGRSYQ